MIAFPLIMTVFVLLVGLFAGAGRVMGGGGIKISSGPGRVLTGGGGKSDFVDSATREVDIAAVNTWTALTNFGATAAGNVRVPTKATYLTKIEISTAFDVNSTAAVYKLLSAIRLSGPGMKNGGNYRFIGQVGTHVQVNAFSAMSRHKVQVYLTRIPVNGGDDITIEGAMLAEDCGDVTMAVTLHFGLGDPGAGIVDGDIRHANITAVDTPTALTLVGADTLGAFQVPGNRTKIIGVVTAMAVDFAAGAAAQRAIGALAITGAGMESGGSYQLQTETYAYSGQGSAGDGLGGESTIHDVDLDVSPNGQITVNAQMVGEDSGDVEFAVGLLYE